MLGLGDMTSVELCVLAVTSPGLRDRIEKELAMRARKPHATRSAAGGRAGDGKVAPASARMALGTR